MHKQHRQINRLAPLSRTQWSQVGCLADEKNCSKCSVTRRWNKKQPKFPKQCPKRSHKSFNLQSNAFHCSLENFYLFGPLLLENLWPTTFKNRPIGSHCRPSVTLDSSKSRTAREEREKKYFDSILHNLKRAFESGNRQTRRARSCQVFSYYVTFSATNHHHHQ